MAGNGIRQGNFFVRGNVLVRFGGGLVELFSHKTHRYSSSECTVITINNSRFFFCLIY